MTILEQMGQKAKEAARALAVAGAKKDAALLKMADAIEAHEAEILAANEKDLQAARESGMRKSMLDRLALTSARIAGMAQGVREVAAQEDPIGQVVSGFVRPNGLQIQRVRVPLGVIGIIYEARPNVTADAAALCLKAGNAVILRGGKEAIHSNTAVAEAMRQAVEEAGLPADCIQLVQDTTRASLHRDDGPDRLPGRAHPARRRRADPLRGGEFPCPRDPDRRGELPRLCGRLRGHRYGGQHRL